jgi:RimJ/RimL family protein N-acetyltransferase
MYGADMRNGTGKLAGILDPYYRSAGDLEAFELLIDYLFMQFPLRKLYGEVGGHSFQQFPAIASGAAQLEGTLKAHEFYDGRYWDLYQYAIYRDDWLAAQAARQSGRLVTMIKAAETESGSRAIEGTQ